jgi:ABC-type transporter Mla MlaB component
MSALDVMPLTDRCGLRLVGDLDASTRPMLTAAMAAFRSCERDVHLDLADLGFIDVGGASAVVSVARQGRPGRRIIVHRPPRQFPRIVDLLWGQVPTIEMEAR